MPNETQPGDGRGPLHGLTVLECASIVLGPMTAQFLGDMGADVIKIEPPEGDLTRAIGPRRHEKMGSFFLGNNRNKRSVVLDLKRPEPRQALRKLLTRSDVFLHSIRSAAAARLGIDYAALASYKPDLVYCQVKGFSDAGPYGGRPAYDDVVQSLCGLAMLQKVIADVPRYMPSIFADKVTAVHAAYAISVALLHRERTGIGQEVDVPMFETMASFNMAEHIWGYAFEPPLGPMGYEPVSTASRRPFSTVDGYLSLLPYSDPQWRRFFELIGRSDIMEDERFSTFAARQRNVNLVWNEIAAQLALRTTGEWVAILEKEDIPFAPVQSLEDLLDDPHLKATNFWQVLTDPVEGALRFPSSPFGLSASPASIRRLPPQLGEHTVEVLTEFGISDSLIEQVVAHNS